MHYITKYKIINYIRSSSIDTRVINQYIQIELITNLYGRRKTANYWVAAIVNHHN